MDLYLSNYVSFVARVINVFVYRCLDEDTQEDLKILLVSFKKNSDFLVLFALDFIIFLCSVDSFR